MKKFTFMVLMGCLCLIPVLAQCQLDKRPDPFPDKWDSRFRPEDLRVVRLEFSPDPAREGQWVSFRLTVLNGSRQSRRITLTLKDRDEIITEARDVNILPGENRIYFSERNYRFSRSDYCFTVEAEIDQHRRSIEMIEEFCARKTIRGWTLSDRRVGLLFVEDLDMNPDPATSGQAVRFRVRLRNNGKPLWGNIRIQDKDQVVIQVKNALIPGGYSDFQFPYTQYSFQRTDHCFTVLVDFEGTPYVVDAVREFCAKPLGWTLRP